MTEEAWREVLVDTSWVADNLDEIARDEGPYRIVEVDVDTEAYGQGHIHGAVGWSWTEELNDPVQRDVVDRTGFEKLLSRSGIDNDATVLLYGDTDNWFAAFAFWLLKFYGHRKVQLVDGGRKKWTDEGRPLETEVPTFAPRQYEVLEVHEDLRAYRPDVERAIERNTPLIDVRSPAEYTGEILAPPGLAETAQRGGHIPGALSVPWSKAVKEDGTFKALDELEKVYLKDAGLQGEEVIAYCRIGERSSHTWFALKYLLGLRNVKNYDGSWTEWGNLVRAPVVTGELPQE
ncbi:MAG: sulfurtransferase [candidate division NC10 bacterium]